MMAVAQTLNKHLDGAEMKKIGKLFKPPIGDSSNAQFQQILRARRIKEESGVKYNHLRTNSNGGMNQVLLKELEEKNLLGDIDHVVFSNQQKQPRLSQ